MWMSFQCNQASGRQTQYDDFNRHKSYDYPQGNGIEIPL